MYLFYISVLWIWLRIIHIRFSLNFFIFMHQITDPFFCAVYMETKTDSVVCKRGWLIVITSEFLQCTQCPPQVTPSNTTHLSTCYGTLIQRERLMALSRITNSRRRAHAPGIVLVVRVLSEPEWATRRCHLTPTTERVRPTLFSFAPWTCHVA